MHVFLAGVPILAPSPEFLLSAYDDSSVLSIWHHTANNVGCTDEPVHVEPCCRDQICTVDPLSSSHVLRCDRNGADSSCASMRASYFSPDACSRESLIEWLPRIQTAIFPFVLQFDSVDELFDIMTAMKQNDDFNIQIRQQMRRETMRLAVHNAGKFPFHALASCMD